MRLMLVEDDVPFGAALRDGLMQGGHDVMWLTEGRGVGDQLGVQRYDAMLLDLTLPDIDGQEVLRAMRARHDETPVLVISARGQRVDRIDMLDRGADDYLVKPIDIGELEARLRAVTRRGRIEPSALEPLQHGALKLDPAAGSVTLRGKRIPLRERERMLLELFMRHRDHVYTRGQIEAEIYGGSTGIESNTIEVYVHYLRRRIASDVILTVRGRGYRLGPPQPES